MTSPHALLIAAVLTGLALAGCGKSASDSAAEAAIKTATGGKVDVSHSGDQQQVTIKDEQGNEVKMNTGSDLALPKDFPSDVHLPSSYTLKSVVQMGPAVVLDLHSPAAAQTVYAEYDSQMKSAGWTEAMAMQSGESGSMLTFQKDRRSVVVQIGASTDAGGGSDIHVQSTSGQE